MKTSDNNKQKRRIILIPALRQHMSRRIFYVATGSVLITIAAITFFQFAKPGKGYTLPVTTITASGSTTICEGGSGVQLCANSGGTLYSWSPGGATTQCIVAQNPGHYVVNVTYSADYSDTAGINVIVTSAPGVSISANGPITICQGRSVQLCANGATNYVWNTGATTSCITVTSAGTYSVAGTNPNSCAGTDMVVIHSDPCCGDVSTIVSNFNGNSVAKGNYIWFSSVVKASNSANYPVTINFTGQQISSSAFNLSLPDAKLIIAPSYKQATTIFDGTEWVTTVPPNLSGNYFLSGYAYMTPSVIPGGINPVTWSGAFTSSDASTKIQWQWAAAVYTKFSSNMAVLGMKATDDNHYLPYQNSDHAGTPENYKNYVTGGTRGGGGSNYTGSYSPTASANPCITAQTRISDNPETSPVLPLSIMKSYPNPFTNNFNINYSVAVAGEVHIQITNFSGQMVYKETIIANKGLNTYSFADNNHLPAGIYIVSLNCNGEVVRNNMVKQ